MRILSIAAMLLSFGVTADAQRVSNRFPRDNLLGLCVTGQGRLGRPHI